MIHDYDYVYPFAAYVEINVKFISVETRRRYGRL